MRIDRTTDSRIGPTPERERDTTKTMKSTTSGTRDGHRFHCPECAQEIPVDEELQAGLLEHGCPLCGAAVTEVAFSCA